MFKFPGSCFNFWISLLSPLFCQIKCTEYVCDHVLVFCRGYCFAVPWNVSLFHITHGDGWLLRVCNEQKEKKEEKSPEWKASVSGFVNASKGATIKWRFLYDLVLTGGSISRASSLCFPSGMNWWWHSINKCWTIFVLTVYLFSISLKAARVLMVAWWGQFAAVVLIDVR